MPSSYVVIYAVIYVAFLLDLLIGDPYRFPHPVKFIGKYVNWCEALVRRLTSSPAGLRWGGLFLAVSTVAITYVLAYYLLQSAAKINIWLYHGLNIALMWTTLAAKSLATEGMKIYGALAAGDISQARTQLSYIVGRDTERLDESGIVRGTVETIAENTSDGVVAPLFYLFLGGAPLALAYKAVNTLDSMVGYKDERYLHLGWASARLDDLANLIPARISGVLLGLAAWLLKLDFRASWRILRRDRQKHSSPNSGYPEAAVAGALGVSLGGTNSYFGQPVVKPTIGDSTRLLYKEDIKLTIKLMYGAAGLAILVFSLAAWAAWAAGAVL